MFPNASILYLRPGFNFTMEMSVIISMNSGFLLPRRNIRFRLALFVDDSLACFLDTVIHIYGHRGISRLMIRV